MADQPSTDIELAVTIPGERLLIAVTELVKVIVEGQPPEVKKQLWEWYAEDMRRIRKLFQLET